MNVRFGLLGLSSLCALLACQPQTSTTPPAPEAADAPGSTTVVAEIDGEPITESELDDWIKDELFAQQAQGGPAKLYELRSDALQRMISERAIALAAAKRGVDEATVIREARASLGEVSDEEVKTFYDENQQHMRGASLEEISDQIRSFLEQRREMEAAKAVVEQAKVVVHLEAPRFDIAPDGPAKGPQDAPVTIVEFSDFQCPYCKRADNVVKQILEKYPNDVRVVYRHMPLDNIHPRARPAAEAAACAADQDRFWEYHDKLFENQRELSDENLKLFAKDLGLDTAKFDACVDQRTHEDKVESDADAARSAGVTGTPAFFVNGRMLTGARPAEAFYEIIEAELHTGADTGAETGTESSG